MIVLGIDPGTASTGYGLIQGISGKKSILDYGVIKTPSHEKMPKRLLCIYNEITRLVNHYKPDVIAVEEIFHQKNSKTAITVAQGRGVVLFSAAKAGLTVAEYTPLQVKQAVVGQGNADKMQVQYMVKKILLMKEIPRPDDAADALAVAICHLHSYRMLNLNKGGSQR